MALQGAVRPGAMVSGCPGGAGQISIASLKSFRMVAVEALSGLQEGFLIFPRQISLPPEEQLIQASHKMEGFCPYALTCPEGACMLYMSACYRAITWQASERSFCFKGYKTLKSLIILAILPFYMLHLTGFINGIIPCQNQKGFLIHINVI